MFKVKSFNWKHALGRKNIFLGGLVLCTSLLLSCKHYVNTPPDTKHLIAFNDKYFTLVEDVLKEDNLQLYVDYSTCNALGQNSSFYQSAITPSFVSASKKYYSIEGKQIIEHMVDSTYTLLRSIREVNYADLKTAAERIANGDSEGALITDGEYYEPSLAAGNITNPYMTKALKTWLLKGHDVFILVEPYQEPCRGQLFDKKRFYFLFTDTRIPNNIWNRIEQTSKLENYPEVEMFHLSISRPLLKTDKEKDYSTPNEILAASISRNGRFEIQDWSVDWEPIESIIMGAVDQNTGEPLPNGDKVISGLYLDRNSFGALKINEIGLSIYNINDSYNDFYYSKEAETPISASVSLNENQGFLIDEKEFAKHSSINIYFDPINWNPDILLDGKPFNYFKIDLYIKSIQNVFNQYSKIFEFTSVDCQLGQTNVSIEKSIEQCLADPAVMNHMNKTPFYTIYVKSNKK